MSSENTNRHQVDYIEVSSTRLEVITLGNSSQIQLDRDHMI